MSYLPSSGYNDIQATPLASGVAYAGTIIDKNIEKDFISRITNSSVLSSLTRCGETVSFNKPARVGPWRTYELNEQLKVDQPSTSSFCVTICNAAYKSIKIDKLTIHKACENWEPFEASFLADAWKNLSDLWRDYVLSAMRIQTSKRNVGKNAGRYGNIDLGTVGNPLVLNPDNLVNFFARLQTVLGDAGRWYGGEMFILVPRAMSTLILESMFAKQLCCDMSSSVLFNGLKADDIMGFVVIETDHLHPVVNPSTGKLEYPILAGWNEAFAFTGDIVEAEIKPISGSFGITYDMLTVYGGGIIYPEALTGAWVSFYNDGVANLGGN